MAFFNPFRQAYLDDPHPVLHRLRAQEPVHWSQDLDAWVLTSYEHCLRAIQDDDCFSSNPAHAAGTLGEDVARKRAEAPLGHAPIMGNSDPPAHTRLRAIVNRGFTPRAIAAARPAIEQTVRALLEDIDPGEPFEVVSRYAEPLAVSVVLDHLGVPREDFGPFRARSLALMRARSEGASQPGVIEAAEQARGEMLDYLAHLAERREREGADSSLDVVSVLLEACDDEALSPEEMLMMLIHISLAGNGPTSMATGNALGILAEHPAVQERLLSEPETIPAAVEEILRFESSTHFVVRFALSDTKMGTRTIRAGQQVHAMVGAANRDPARFPDPDRFDVDRADKRHLAFGHGIHFCLGAPLARLELEVAIAGFLREFGVFERISAKRAPNYQLRGFEHLLIRGSGARH